ncbi:GlsB/YeaQ/YmgE family stress response membrane protein [Yinghuangia soli]|uniref:GlsB/YeaQ/YmgE family stress response membrane protein n=1 Tax=Yinghuangia soli TaxID=2908204 RepID=A0AA41Q1X5_9ACTN|nr:GlsB/YeaQ/YmgE family stress response membrane protein [Yinghuangia soli]MCF2529251.1 GlsB/YeaQ/YmgE family stress response membrane protein [Yinghuangia soli]
MGIIAWIVLGLAAGIIAKMLVPGQDPGGLIVTALIGMTGALVGGFIAVQVFDVDGTQGFFNLSTWVSAIAGSILLLVAYRAITNRGSGHSRGRRGLRRRTARR